MDGLILGGIFGLLWSVLHFGAGMFVHFDPATVPAIELGIGHIPYYAGRTLLRMWIAFCFSLFFTFVVGYCAAKSRGARAFILPALDVLQSVPVLGFLAATVTGFMALFPGSLLGVECASLFAIFTGQVWNMTLGFYHSMATIPVELEEVATVFRLSRWQRFLTLEAPASIHSLLWNSMMSFGGGWFFVSQSEALSVMNQSIKLPGLGSYMALAVERGDKYSAACAVGAMLLIMVASDQLIWRPLIVWAERFKLDLTESQAPPHSWVYECLRRAFLFEWISQRLLQPVRDAVLGMRSAVRPALNPERARGKWGRWLLRTALLLAGLWVGRLSVLGLWEAIDTVRLNVASETLLRIAWLGCLTLSRVFLMTLLATLVWIPVGVWIGFKPAVARFAQPLAQIAASFPVNMTFPIVVGLFVAWRVPMNWGSILLIGMGTQWYLLFNVIAGAMAIPNDLREVAQAYGLRGWPLWRTLILPGIFPFWVTGACTAAGGAWNASIVAELATWGDTTLRADGLGAFIVDATQRGDTPLVISSIAIMSVFVIVTNQCLWRRLYALAERRYRMG